MHEGEYNLESFSSFTDVQIVGLGKGATLICPKLCVVFSHICFFENIIFPKGNLGLVCQGKKSVIHMNHCEISAGMRSCEDFPECNGGPGCKATSRGKPVCDRTGKYGEPFSNSGMVGSPGVQIVRGAFGLIENCKIHNCGGGATLVAMEDSLMEVRKCEVYKNNQSGLEAREGGQLIASGNRIFDNGQHGVVLGPKAGECDIDDNKIFENRSEGILVISNAKKIDIRNNDVHHNGPFGLSLDENSHLFIRNNKIFENGFWGIIAKTRTSANITANVISGNKCGGIFIGVNFSGRIFLESNTVRDHGGPWLECGKTKDSFPVDEGILLNLMTDRWKSPFYIPSGEKSEFYSKPPTLVENKVFNNEEGIYHPREIVERVYSGCTFCRHSGNNKSHLMKCSTCQIASYCSKECQSKHWQTHKALCEALKSRYSVTVKILPFCTFGPGQGKPFNRTFGSHLKGLGTGPKRSRNSRKKFIVKIQTQSLNSHPLQLLILYDKSLSLDCTIQSSEIFSVIMECGVLGELHKFTSKKCFFWAMFAEEGEKLTIFLNHLAPYQQW